MVPILPVLCFRRTGEKREQVGQWRTIHAQEGEERMQHWWQGEWQDFFKKRTQERDAAMQGKKSRMLRAKATTAGKRRVGQIWGRRGVWGSRGESRWSTNAEKWENQAENKWMGWSIMRKERAMEMDSVEKEKKPWEILEALGQEATG